MRDVWTLPAVANWEKAKCADLQRKHDGEQIERIKHPTQKPLALLARIILASTKENAWILDPFSGSSTTGIAASLLKRRFLGIERESDFLEMSKSRRLEIEDAKTRYEYHKKITPCTSECIESKRQILEVREEVPYFGIDLPF